MKLIQKNWFLIALIVILIIGFFFAKPLETVSNFSWLKWSVVSLTMFLMAWPLELYQIKKSFSQPLPPLIACGVNLVFIPIVVWPLTWFAGSELGPGMLIAAATPSTLASAAVFTRRAGGDDSIAVLVTILTNGTCFLVMPFWIYVQTGSQIESELLTGTIFKLLFFVVVPIVLAQLSRASNQLANWSTRNKPMLSRMALIGILIMVLLGAAKMGLRFEGDHDRQFDVGKLVYVVVAMCLVHLISLALGIWLARLAGLERESWIAVGFSGSQKTLMIGLSTAINLGMSIVPIVIYHTGQLIIDSFVVERFRRFKPSTSEDPPS